MLKLREKALIDKTNAELTWLEQMKKKVQDKGEDEKMPSILKKEKGIMQKLKEEQVCLSFLTEIFFFKLINLRSCRFVKENINQLKEVQRRATENRLKILSQHSEVIKWCQNKLKKQQQTPAALQADSSFKESSEQQNKTVSNESEAATPNVDEDEQPNQLDESTINQSLIESKIMKQVKQHLNSEK